MTRFLSCRAQLVSSGPICEDWLQKAQLADYRERGWESILAATPCDLWRFLRGRTLWIMGDSQSQDLFKALQCFLHECVSGLRDCGVLGLWSVHVHMLAACAATYFCTWKCH